MSNNSTPKPAPRIGIILRLAALIALLLPLVASAQFKGVDLAEIDRQRAENQLLQEKVRAQQLENEQRAQDLQRAQQKQETQAQVQAASDAPNAPAAILARYQEAIKYRQYRWNDFEKVTTAPELQLSLDMVALIAESRYAADIVYYLGKHPEESAAISKMALPDAGRAIFSLEKKIKDALD